MYSYTASFQQNIFAPSKNNLDANDLPFESPIRDLLEFWNEP